MRTKDEIIAEVKKFYIEKSLEFQGRVEMKKTLQSLAITVIYLENNKEEKYLLRNARNMLHDMNKEIREKDGKNLTKEMLKLIK